VVEWYELTVHNENLILFLFLIIIGCAYMPQVQRSPRMNSGAHLMRELSDDLNADESGLFYPLVIIGTISTGLLK
jgi:hypothetical protein